MVNVNDFDNSKLPEGDRLMLIFTRQAELMHKYDPIEEKNVGHPLPHGVFNLDVPACQQRLKDFAWRVTEELAEATEALDSDEQTHFLEELIDAFHFFVELMIHSGISAQDFDAEQDRLKELVEKGPGLQVAFIRDSAYDVVEGLGLAMNCLKNKPWKQSHMITDRQKYLDNVKEAFRDFCALLNYAGLDYNSATVFYFNKNDVNQFRIRSAY